MSTLLGQVIVDKVQPQTAAYISVANRSGLVTRPGHSLAWLAITPTADIERVIDIGVKRNDIKLSFLQMDSRVGFVVFQAEDVSELRDAVEAITEEMALEVPDAGIRSMPLQLVSGVDPRQAYLKNKSKLGSLCIPGDALCTAEFDPPGMALLAVNEAEKASNIRIVDFKFTGSMGRMIVSGDDSSVRAARDVVLSLAEEAS